MEVPVKPSVVEKGLITNSSSSGGSSRVAKITLRSGRGTTEEPHIGRYRLLKTIGKGNFAKVKLAKHLPTGKEVQSFFICVRFSRMLIICPFLFIGCH